MVSSTSLGESREKNRLCFLVYGTVKARSKPVINGSIDAYKWSYNSLNKVIIDL